MNGWKEQWYGYVPGALITTSTVAIGAIDLASNTPGVSDVAVCGWLSMFVKWTVSPAFTVTDLFMSPNVKFEIVMPAGPELPAALPDEVELDEPTFVPPPHAARAMARATVEISTVVRFIGALFGPTRRDG
jgi:hypothetical protein